MNGRSTWSALHLLCAVAILAGLLATPGAAPPRALANHTGTPTRVTVPGSFNSELGCTSRSSSAGGDWEPGCNSNPGATPATPNPPGPTDLADQGNGVWAATLGPIPTGGYEYKVALNGAWDESYAGRPTVNDNTGLTLAAPRTVRFVYDHKTHFVADNVNQTIYTVPGSFNGELGCAGDWAADCLRTLMSDVDGDGVYTFSTSTIPAGSYEFKVATNESWDNPNYGANGGGNNVPFTVPAAGVAVTFSFNTTGNLPTVAVAEPPAPPPADAALIRAPASDPANQDEIIYFLMTDRFANGDNANNTGGIAGGPLANGYKPDDKAYHHGGDLKGLKDKLPYLQQLGVTAIWMTPPFKNKPVQGDGTLAGSSSSYHGYWITDFTQVDPHLGTNQEMKDLIAAAHAAGINVIFDIVANHTADVLDYEGGNRGYVPRTGDARYRDAGGNLFDDRDYINDPDFPELDRYSFPRRPVVRDPAEAGIKFPNWLDDPTNYHNRGDAAYDGSEAELYGDIAGLDDLFTEKPEVVTGLTNIYKYWIQEFGIDGYRVDTAKHVNDEFWQYFVPEIRRFAATKGKPNFYIYGEVLNGDPAYLSRFTREARFPAVLDFGFNYAAQDFALGRQDAGRLSGLFAADDYYTTPSGNAYNLPTFLGNHDIGRFGAAMREPAAGDTADAQRVSRMLLGYGLMFTARGVPVIYYGDEQGFTGDGGDKDARQDMFPSQVPGYNDDDLIGTSRTTADDNFDPNHPLYEGIAALAALRQEHPALQTGAQIERLSDGSVYAFSRIDRGEKREYVVAVNNGNAARTVSLQTFAPSGAAFAGIYGATGNVTANGTGQISLTVPALGMVVYRQQAANTPAGSGTLGPIVTISAPADGSTVAPGLIEVAASVSGNAMAEVTFAVSMGDGPFQPIGTDTNAPYRVFYNASEVPAGTTLRFKAVSTDVLGAAGNFYSATTSVSIAAPEACTVSYAYAVIHYYREDGNYDDWGLHLWGDAIADGEATDWNAPKPFDGRDDYGVFAWVRLKDQSKPVNFIVHKPGGDSVPDTRDPGGDRSFVPAENPEIWLKGGDATVYTSQAAAQGYVTIHYQRPAGDYNIGQPNYWGAHVFGDGVTDPGWATPIPGALGQPTYGFTDTFGLAIRVPVSDATKRMGFIIHQPSGDEVPATREPGGDRFIIPAETPNIWIKQGDERVYRSRSEAEGVVTLHYHRPDGDYGNYSSSNFNDFWGLHTWAGTATPNPAWEQPFKPVIGPGPDRFGPTFRVRLADDAQNWAYILHRGNTKDRETDQFLNLDRTGHEIWVINGMAGDYPYILPTQPGCTLGGGNRLDKLRAHWVSADTIAWDIVANPQVTYRLHSSRNAGMTFADGDVQGGQSVDLSLVPGGLSDELKAKFPHLADYTALRVPTGVNVKELLKGQLFVSARTAEQGVVEATGLQIPGVLDDLYAAAASSQRLGVSYPGAPGQSMTVRLWAPTAQDVKLLVFPDATSTATTTVQMTLNATTGVWSTAVDANRDGQFYLFQVQVYAPTTGRVETNRVTDPYSVSLSTNSQRSQFANLASAALKPAGWDRMMKPRLDAFEDIVLYELHVRDFSITDQSVPAAQRGTFKAFTQLGSNGMGHLRELSRDGLTHVHLLPVFDIATIEEVPGRRTEVITRFNELRALPPNSEQQQAIIEPLRDRDGFNWGYDPYHYNVPEGSYSTNPNGTTRIVEFRDMVQALNTVGLRVVMDVVYNHTAASGQSEKSVLDKVVPGYYHRLSVASGFEGQVERSTCCENTATEHAMMEKLMIDSVVQWAKEYKVDGFRFDLMGHHMKANMVKLRAALDALTLERDGVDGRKIYLYGEGWNFGEVANGQRGVNATQRNMAGTGIGTFSDRLRDAVRGGGPFDAGVGAKKQGFINGLFTDPNGTDQGSPADQRAALLRATDQIKVGMAGNLASFTLTNSAGQVVRGNDVDYNGSPAGYTADPQEVITYIEAHDNETLFDAIQLKAAPTATITDRVRMQNLGISIVMLGQGIPFFQAGQDFLRSKSGDRNSYNSGDWFNRIDWTLNENAWGSGLPPQGENNDNWDVLRPVLGDPTIKPTRANMVSAYAHFREMLRIRKSSPLFRLRTAAQINSMVSFLNTGPNQTPGLIVMRIQDTGATDIDARAEQVVVLINANKTSVSFTAAELQNVRLQLHPEQRRSFDAAVRGATYNAAVGRFTIPPRTTAVFTDLRSVLFLPIVRK